MSQNQKISLSQIINFLIKESEGLYEDKHRAWLEGTIALHIQYGTFMTIKNDKEEIVAVCRWNVFGNIAHILDLVIRKDYRDFKLIKQMLALGASKNPQCFKIMFDRRKKYPDKMIPRLYDIKEILNGRK